MLNHIIQVGEGADDAGGVFDDTITDMCQEITSNVVPLLVPTPNALNDEGFSRDKYLLNPHLTSSQHLSWFKFVGKYDLYFNKLNSILEALVCVLKA